FSEYWTLWGLLYVFYGWFWGLVAIFFAGFVTHAVYSLVMKLFHGGYQSCIKLGFLYYVTRGVLANMGFDSVFVTLLQGLLGFTAFYVGLTMLESFRQWFGGRG
ncbi:unnamed protein product, partial [marine sediment metagenome]